MTAIRPATETVAFVDSYSAAYRNFFHDVRSFDHFTRLHLGLISDVSRKSLPEIGPDGWGGIRKRFIILSPTPTGT